MARAIPIDEDNLLISIYFVRVLLYYPKLICLFCLKTILNRIGNNLINRQLGVLLGSNYKRYNCLLFFSSKISLYRPRSSNYSI
jgi:uncharacterized membrane protein required for colicin V production